MIQNQKTSTFVIVVGICVALVVGCLTYISQNMFKADTEASASVAASTSASESASGYYLVTRLERVDRSVTPEVTTELQKGFQKVRFMYYVHYNEESKVLEHHELKKSFKEVVKADSSGALKAKVLGKPCVFEQISNDALSLTVRYGGKDSITYVRFILTKVATTLDDPVMLAFVNEQNKQMQNVNSNSLSLKIGVRKQPVQYSNILRMTEHDFMQDYTMPKYEKEQLAVLVQNRIAEAVHLLSFMDSRSLREQGIRIEKNIPANIALGRPRKSPERYVFEHSGFNVAYEDDGILLYKNAKRANSYFPVVSFVDNSLTYVFYPDDIMDLAHAMRFIRAYSKMSLENMHTYSKSEIRSLLRAHCNPRPFNDAPEYILVESYSGSLGLLTSKGKKILRSDYSAIDYDSEHKAFVYKSDRGGCGYYSLEYEKEVPARYAAVRWFKDGLIEVQAGPSRPRAGAWGVYSLNAQREIIRAGEFGYVYQPAMDAFLTKREEHETYYGAVDLNGNVLAQNMYTSFVKLSDTEWLFDSTSEKAFVTRKNGRFNVVKTRNR